MLAYVSIYYYYRTFLARVLRVFYVVLLEWFVLDRITQGVFPKFLVFLLLLFILWEIFFRYKVAAYRPQGSVVDNTGDIYNSFTLQSLEQFIGNKKGEDVVKGLLSHDQIKFVLKKSNINSKDLQFSSINKEELARAAFDLTKKTNSRFVTTLDVFAAYLLATEPKTKFLFDKEIKQEDFLNIIFWAKTKYEDKEIPKKHTPVIWGRGIGENWIFGWMLETKKYAFDFTKRVVKNPPHLAVRETELEGLIQIFLKSSRQNAILVGSPGVGKTTIVAEFALRSFLGSLPSSLSHKRIFELSVGSLLAGSETQGVLEQRIKTMLEELSHAGDIIIYIPQLQNIVGSGGFGFDASGALIPALQGDSIQVIGSVTPENYKKYIERKGEFSALFEKVEVKEPNKTEAIRMLEEASLALEKRHKVNITYKAIAQVVMLADKYVADRFLPGKGIDLLDEAASHAAIEKKRTLTKDDIVKLIETKTKIPVGAPKKEEQELLLNLEKVLHEYIVDQEEAVKTLAQALRRLRVGISFENRPVGVFLFLGPTGVGKTELARALASVYFKSEDRLVVLDMGSYKGAPSIYRLIGSPPGTGDERGELTEKVRENPFSLVLLDEFEKADIDVQDAFLSIFEEGRLTDAKGTVVSFVDTIIIATSNAGSEIIREKVEEGVDLQKLKPIIIDQLQNQGVFKPELLNRFDAVVLFEPLGETETQQVTRLLLDKVGKKLLQQEISLEFDEGVVVKIAKEGYDPQLGARPIRRYIQDNIEELLSQKMLRNEIKRGSKVIFSTDAANNITASVF